MLEGDLNGLLIMHPQFFDGFIAFLKIPKDLYILSGIMVDLHDPQQFQHVFGGSGVDVFELDAHHRFQQD